MFHLMGNDFRKVNNDFGKATSLFPSKWKLESYAFGTTYFQFFFFLKMRLFERLYLKIKYFTVL